MKHILSVGKDLLTNVQEGDSQPNAVDLRVDKIFKLRNEEFEISESYKKLFIFNSLKSEYFI